MEDITGDPETWDWFWVIVDKAQKNEEKLTALLSDLPKEEVARFGIAFQQAASVLTDEKYLEYVDPGVSEDGYNDISYWVVTQGKEYYMQVRKHPEQMPSSSRGLEDSFFSVADNLYLEKWDEELPYPSGFW